MKIVFLDEATVGQLPNLDKIKKLGTYTSYDYTLPSERAARIAGADVVITNKVVLDRELIFDNDSIKLICVAATGTNNIDLVAAQEKGIVVKNVAGYSTDSVVQLTFSLLLELMSHTSQFNKFIHSGEYSRSNSFTSIIPPYNELAGKKYGIIGLGTIGRRVAEVARAFGAEVIYYSTSGKNSTTDFKQVSLDELMSTSDVISIHAPMNDATKGLINKERISQMKPSSYIINVGRGGIIVEKDLADALNNNTIAGAGIDVFTVEPILADNPLLGFKDDSRLVMTPHIAWASVEARERLLDKIADNISTFISSGK